MSATDNAAVVAVQLTQEEEKEKEEQDNDVEEKNPDEKENSSDGAGVRGVIISPPNPSVLPPPSTLLTPSYGLRTSPMLSTVNDRPYFTNDTRHTVSVVRKTDDDGHADHYHTVTIIERLPVTNGVSSLPIRNVTENIEDNVARLPVIVTVTDGVRCVSIQNETETNEEETLNLTNAILDNLTVNNLNTMAKKMIAIKIASKSQLEIMIEQIHQKAMRQPKLSGIFAEMCAMMIDDHRLNTTLRGLDVTVIQVLLPKCYDVMYSYRQKYTTQQTSSPEQYACQLANSVFVAELYNRRVLPETILWSFVMDLARNISNAQVHCLATILKSAGPRLSKTYSLASFVGHMLLVEYDFNRENDMCSDLRNLILDVTKLHAQFWMHEEPDRAVKENMCRVHHTNELRSNMSVSVRMREYAFNLMEHRRV